MADRWKVVERACPALGVIIGAATLYYTAAPYYERHQAQLAPQPNVEAVAMAPPWWLITLAALGVLLLFTGWAMMVLRRRGLSQIHGRMFPIETGVYVGQIALGIDRLDTDLFIEIGVVAYNGTTKLISIGSVEGSIQYEGIRLPTPKILVDRSPNQNLPAAKEFLIVLEQRVPKNVADNILRTLAEKNDKKKVMFDFSGLNIFAFFPPNPQFPARISIWNGLAIDIEGKFPRIGKVISLSANVGI